MEKTLKVFEEDLREEMVEKIRNTASGVALIWAATGVQSTEFINGFADATNFITDLILKKEV